MMGPDTPGPGIRLHPRTLPVARASAHLGMTLIDFQQENGLSDAEMMIALADYTRRLMIHLLRAERHPDNPDQKADEE